MTTRRSNGPIAGSQLALEVARIPPAVTDEHADITLRHPARAEPFQGLCQVPAEPQFAGDVRTCINEFRPPVQKEKMFLVNRATPVKRERRCRRKLLQLIEAATLKSVQHETSSTKPVALGQEDQRRAELRIIRIIAPQKTACLQIHAAKVGRKPMHQERAAGWLVCQNKKTNTHAPL